MKHLKLLFQLAYDGAIEEINACTQRIYAYETAKLQDGRRVTDMPRGAMHLPQRKFMRHISSRHNTWAQRQELSAREYNADHKRLAELVELIEELEAHYKQYHDADEEQAAQAFAEYVRESRTNPKR